MRLENVELKGFKSFADRTKIEFDEKITAVVGPNGSGKSNISDAVRWVLGEQSAKSLRGSKMNDVIFQGGESSKSLNLAEVNLNFSNEDKALDLSYDKVKISRRIYRDGENEYRINGKKVRLKDVRELFLDTGVGKEGYSIISQGRIDEIISSSPKDRRNIFEEASGIAKHKFRRDEASKKLDRVSDDLEVIERDWEYKKKELGLLKTYKENYGENKRLTEKLDQRAYFYLKDKSKALLDEKKEASENITRLDKEINISTVELDNIRKKLAPFTKDYKEVEEEIGKTKDSIDKYNKSIEKSKSKLLLNKQKYDYNSKDLERLRSNISSNEEKREKGQKDLENEEKNLNDNRKRLEEISQSLKENQLIVNKTQSELKDLVAKNSKEELRLNKLASEIYNYEIEEKSKAIIDEKKAKDAEERLAKIKAIDKDLSILEESKMKLEDELKEITNKLKDFQKKEEDYRKNLLNKRKESDDLAKANAENNINLKTLISEFKLQKENLDKNRGYFYSIQDFLNKTKDYGLDNLYLDSLANLIRVKEGYEDVIDNLMGAGLQNIVTRTKLDTRELINFVNKNRLGRITFLPIDSIKSYRKDRPKEDEVIAMAYDLIEADPELTNIIDHFLGSTVVVKDIDSAVSLSNKIRGYRIITLNLDIINNWGSMVAGNDKNRKKNTNLLNRNKRLAEIKERILSLRNKKDSYNKTYREISADINILDDKLKEITSLIEEERNSLRDRENNLSSVNIRIENAIKRKEELSEESDYDLVLTGSLDIDSLRENHGRLKEEIENIKVTIASKEKILSLKEKESINLENTSAMITRDINLIINTITDLKNSLRDLDNSNRMEIKLKGEIDDSLGEIDREDQNLEKAINFSKKKIREEEEKLKILSEDKSKMEEENYNLLDREKKVDERIKELNIEKVKSDYALSTATSKYDSIIDEISPFISQSLDEMDKKYRDLSFDKVSKKSLVDLQRKINTIGFFDENSLEAYKEAKEEFDFLDKQMTDLVNSKSDIETMIKRLEKDMKEEFIKNFNIINEKFARIFKTLFIGGDAKLVLDSDDSLNAGIEIEARPPSKSAKSISLLSGGEKALTAVALLFAIFETNPAPFAILDEIDAALDETNIKRYIEYLTSLSDKTQFIMITHRQTTMQLAERIHGVTIGDDGKSQVYSIDFAKN
ncbi:SMC domain protein [Anaerococcus prevotii DSM 20548]|uniref:Chromosome partition protein Smc n=1 Tax=Anaerococcus prevotii (strain ATCC 9321 / DSM 20548 / JCM 6508 / NCTC 11806 / PC1) TaxID=525919 RepID=C7RGT9_ANAPD|nr:chromosome segregation protein SMC [Anaerococcus prevotii]ACV28700.1 SMC domain protein [Anaerococcus prevotii DSM 20548]